MRFERARFEFGMELAAQEPRVIGRLHDFNVVFVGSAASDAKPRRDQDFLVVAIEFVAMPMPLADFELAVSFSGEGAGLELARPSTQTHGAAHFVNAKQFTEFV